MKNYLLMPECTQENALVESLSVRGKGKGKPFICDVCFKTFPARESLRKHYRTHTGEKPFSCKVCNKAFALQGNLNIHLRIHSDERPYKCQFCDYSDKFSSNLKRHVRTKHCELSCGGKD